MSIVAFHGADHKCGTSMIAQCVAEKLAAANPSRSVLLVHTEARGGNEYAPHVSESMERIRPYMSGHLIDTDEIIEKAKVTENLSIIGGSETPESSWDYHPDMAAFFLSSIRERYDWILCDSGNDLEHGLALGSLLAADARVLVLTQNEAAVCRYEWHRSLLDRLSISFDRYAVNLYERSGIYSKKYLQERLSLSEEELCTVRRSSFGECAEIDRKSLLQYRDPVFSKDIGKLASYIVGQTYGSI